MQIKNTSSDMKVSLVEIILLLFLGPVLWISGDMPQKIYVIFFHTVSALFFSGGLLISMCFFFRVKWSEIFKSRYALWESFALRWPLLCLPFILIGHNVFSWDEFHETKAIYFATPFLIFRFLLYSGLNVFALKVAKKWTALSVIIFVFVGTFFAFDTGLVLEGQWVSNMYPLIYLASGACGVFALFILFTANHSDIKERLDLMRMLITLTAIWAYFHYSQFLILWMGNKPSEVAWYVARGFAGIPVLALVIISLKSLLVFFLGLLGKFKTNVQAMKLTALSVVIGYFLETNWLMAPPLEVPMMLAILYSLIMTGVLGILLLRWVRRYA